MKKQLTILAISLGLVASVGADMEFRSSNPIDVYNQFDMNSNSITNLADPGSDSEALNQGYADGRYLMRNGDTLQGNLDTDGNEIINLPTPDANSDAATKAYVDNEVSGIEGSQDLSDVLAEGSTANQSVNLGSNKITNLATPSASSDAVTVGYANSNYFDRENGDSVNGSIDLLNNDIKNLENPDSPQDAATQSYVQTYADSNDETGTDNQTLSIDNSVNGQDSNITIEDGNSVTVQDSYEPNTNTQLDDQQAESNVDMNGYNITSSDGEMCIGSNC